MTFTEFEEIVDKMVAGSKTLDAAYNLKIDLFEMLNDHHCVVDKLWGHILTESGEEWLWWYMYEKNGISGTPREDMTANDEDGTEICKDLKDLYDYLVKYNHFKINNNEI